MDDVKLFSEMVNQKCEEIDNLYLSDPEINENFKKFVLDAGNEQLFRVNVYQLADELDVDKQAFLVHFLHAAKVGLFNLNWDIHCPHCDGVAEQVLHLDSMNSTALCWMCDIRFNTSFDETVEVTFTLNANIKPVFAPLRCELPDQVETRVRMSIPAGESRTANVTLEPGNYTFMCPVIGAKGLISVSDEASEDSQSVELIQANAQFNQTDIALKQGEVSIIIKNETPAETGFFLYAKDLPELDVTLLEQRVFGFQCATIPAFTELFSDEVFSGRENLQIRDATILFTDITGSTQLFERLGDPKAYNLVKNHFNILFEMIEKNNGIVVKTIGDAVMACFTRPVDGMKSALLAIDAFNKFNQREGGKEAVIIKIGIHHGPCIAVNLNDRLDYFGTTVNMASRIQNLSQGKDIFASESMINDLRVKGILAEKGITTVKRFQVELKGLKGEHSIYKVV